MILVRVNFVNAAVRWIQSVLRAGLGIYRLERSAGLVTYHGVCKRFQHELLTQRRDFFNNPLRHIEYDPGLRSGCRGAYNLRTVFLLAAEAIEQRCGT